jgi:hypothetical protein
VQSQRSVMDTLQMIRQVLREESMSHTWKVQTHQDRKKARQVKSKSMHIIFFDIKGIVQKNSSWKNKRSIIYTTATFYDDCMKMCEDFTPNFSVYFPNIYPRSQLITFISLSLFCLFTTCFGPYGPSSGET